MVKWDCTNNTACISLNAKQLIDKQRIGRTMGRTRVFLSLIQEINYQHSSSFCYLKNRFHLLSLMLQADEIHVELLSDHWNTLRINSSELQPTCGSARSCGPGAGDGGGALLMVWPATQGGGVPRHRGMSQHGGRLHRAPRPAVLLGNRQKVEPLVAREALVHSEQRVTQPV